MLASTSNQLFVHPKQGEVFRDKHRFKVVVAGRRWGKSKLALAEIINHARIPNQYIWYVAPSYRMARAIMWRDLVASMPFAWIKKKNDTMMTMLLVNGTLIEMKGCDKKDNLRGVGLHQVIIDEAQDIDEDTWYKVLRPTLSSTRGKAIIIGCVNRNTLVLPRSGMTPIETFSVGSPDKTLDSMREPLYGLDRSFHIADGFWNNGVVATKSVVTHAGFRLEASLPHPVLVMNEDGRQAWRRMDELRVGDRVAIDRGMEVWGDVDPVKGWNEHFDRWREQQSHGKAIVPFRPDSMTDDLAYFLGLWIAEGSVEPDVGRVTITCGDAEVGTFLESGQVCGLVFKRRSGRADQWAVNSKALVEFMRWLGMPLVKAPIKTLPLWVARGSRAWATAFIAGMWDGDGFCSCGVPRVGYTSASRELVGGLQLLLSNFGILSRITTHVTLPTARVRVSSVQHRLIVQGPEIARFRSTIRLRIARKQAVLERIVVSDWSRRDGVPNQGLLLRRVRNALRRRDGELKVDRGCFSAAIETDADISYRTLQKFVETHRSASHLEDFAALETNLNNHYFWDRVVSISDSQSLTYDFTIPDTHSFWSNGFVSHNTPKQFNWLYTVYMLGQRGEVYEQGGVVRKNQWKSWQFPTCTSPFISESELEQAKHDMDEKSYRQEFEASFLSMSGRVYYAFDRSVHLRDCRFNPHLPIWVGQDFNIDPMASVILQPQANGDVWVVDEIIIPNSNVEEVANELERRYWRFISQVIIYPDASGGNRQHAKGESSLQILREHGFGRQKYRRRNPYRIDRINAVNRKFRTADGTVGLYISHRCKHLIKGLEQLIYKEGTPEVDKSSGGDHPTDALGYPIELEFPVRKISSMGLSI